MEWDEEQRGWVLALSEYKAGLCPACGRPLEVCTDPSSEDGWSVPPPTRCFATTAISIAQKPYLDRSQPEALLWRAERKR